MSIVSGNKLNDLYQEGIRPNSNTYVVCSTAAATAAKTVSSTGFELTSGKHITIKFTNGNSAKNLTLQVNSLAAKPIYYHGSDIGEQPIPENSVIEFVYNGTQFECIGGIGESGRELTKAQYDALPSDEKAKGDYYIYDTDSFTGFIDGALDKTSGNAISNHAVASKFETVDSSISTISASLTEKVTQKEGNISVEGSTISSTALDWVTWDETNGRMILHKKGTGADAGFPFSGGKIKEYLTFSNRPYSEGGYQVVGGLFISNNITIIPSNTVKADFLPMQDLLSNYVFGYTSSITIAKAGYYIIQEGALTHYDVGDTVTSATGYTVLWSIFYFGETNPFA